MWKLVLCHFANVYITAYLPNNKSFPHNAISNVSIRYRNIVYPPDGLTARGGPWPPLQYASRPLDSLFCLSIRLHPSFSGPWTRHPAIAFLVFLFVLLHTAFRTTSFLGLRCLAFFLYDQAIVCRNFVYFVQSLISLFCIKCSRTLPAQPSFLKQIS